MVLDAVWQEAAPDDDAFRFRFLDLSTERYYLCIGCLERRLGRELTAADFYDCPANTPDNPWNTPRLADRLCRQ